MGTAADLWSRLDLPLKRDIAEAFWTAETQDEAWESILNETAARRKFRTQGLKRMPLDVRTRVLASLAKAVGG